MSETKNWRSTRSYGVILARYNEHLNIPEYLMVCRKSTYCYVDFILGKYDDKNTDYLKLSKYFIIFLSFIAFVVASKGFSVLYLFLLADLFCCAFVLTVFYSFYNKQLNEKTAYISIIIGLIGGFLLFPAPDFSKSLLVGVILPIELFPKFVSQSLLFLSFFIATFSPTVIWKLR